MGRVKLKIKRLENMSGRHITYSKRRAGILKKAKELSILCDIEIALLMFSPTGKPTLCLGDRSKTEEILTKFAQMSPQEREKRKLESLEALKKAFKKLGHEINIPEFLESSAQTVEELSNQTQNLQSQIFEVQRKLSFWTDPDNVNGVDQITQMEITLRDAINRIQIYKKYMGNQFVQLDCADEFTNAMQLPMDVANEHQPSNLQWLLEGDDQHFMLSGVPSFIPQRNYLCSTEPSSLQGYHGYAINEKEAVCYKHEQQESLINLGRTPCLQLQNGVQCPLYSYDMNIFGEKKFHPNGEVALSEGYIDFQANGFEPTRPGFDAELQKWVAATSKACGVSIPGDHPYTQLEVLGEPAQPGPHQACEGPGL